MSLHPRRLRSGSILGPATTTTRPRTRNDALEAMFATGFPYSRKLTGHTSCVNALAFSSGDGRFLASGGDDLFIRLWDFHQDDVKSPSFTLVGPRGNIFALAFSATNRYLYSGGTDETVFKYDVAHMGSSLQTQTQPKDTFREHHESIRGITCHPVHDELSMSASEDGRVIRHDGRAGNCSARAQDTLQLKNEVTGVQYHPVTEHLFATSEQSGRVCLRDARMAFGPLTQRSRQGVVQLYNTKITRISKRYMSNPEASSISFDREGSKLAVTFLHYLPTIYSLSDSHPIATCSGQNLPDGTPVLPSEKTYSNSCTMKHGSFGGPGLENDELYSAGSDDFRAYVWKIPRVSELVERRQEISADEWMGDNIAFAEGMSKPRYVPVELSTPLYRLTGHDSIVNTTVIHPHFLHIVTSGIERHIILHSPTPASPCSQNLEPTPTDVRRISVEGEDDRDTYFRALVGLRQSDSEDEAENSERSTMSLFDHILREEGEADPFEERRWNDDDDEEEEE